MGRSLDSVGIEAAFALSIKQLRKNFHTESDKCEEDHQNPKQAPCPIEKSQEFSCAMRILSMSQ